MARGRHLQRNLIWLHIIIDFKNNVMKKQGNQESEKKQTFQNLTPSKFPHGMTRLDKMIMQNSNSKSILYSNSLRSLNQSQAESNENYNTENIGRNVKPCLNHSNKPGIYEVKIDSQSSVFCEKCAILLASQGFKASKIGKGSIFLVPDSARSGSLSDDMDSIVCLANSICKSLGDKKAELKQFKEQSENIIYNQYQGLNNYFNKLEAMIAYQRNLYNEYLNQEQKKVQSVYNSLQNLLSISIKDIFGMKRSIKEMSEQIKRGLSISQKLEDCRSQLLNCQEISLSWDREDLLPKVIFSESQELEEVMSFNTVNKIGIGWDRMNAMNNSIHFSFDVERRELERGIK